MKNQFSGKTILAILLSCYALQGCGVKGELVLPVEQNDQETTQTSAEISVEGEQ